MQNTSENYDKNKNLQ